MASAQAVHRRRSWSSPTCDFFRRSAHNRRCRHRSRIYALLACYCRQRHLASGTKSASSSRRLVAKASFRAMRVRSIGATSVPRARFDALFGCMQIRSFVHDAHTLRSLVEVLQGSFQCVTVGELRAKGGTRQPHVADGLFAVPQRAPKRQACCASEEEAAAPTTKLLHSSGPVARRGWRARRARRRATRSTLVIF